MVDLIQELTDVDTLNESEEGATAVVDSLVSIRKISAFILRGVLSRGLCSARTAPKDSKRRYRIFDISK